jgi:ParB family chromosome partitioning protein
MNGLGRIGGIQIMTEIVEIPVDKVDLLYTREGVEEKEVEELAESIRSLGLAQLPLVRFDEKTGRYQLIVGTRRYLAVKKLGLEKLQARLVDVDDVRARALSLVENVQRKDLSDMELAKRLRELKELGKYSAKELAALLGKSEGWVLDHLRMIEPIEEGVKKACEEIKPTAISIARAMEMVIGKMTSKHAKTLLKQEEPVRSQLFKEIVKEVVEKGTMPSARALERRAEELKEELAKPKEAVVEAVQAPQPSPPSAEVKAEKPEEEPKVIYRAEIKTPEDVERAFAQVLGPKPAVAPAAPATPTPAPAPAITTAVEAAGVTVETAVDALNAKLRELGELLSGIEGLGSKLVGHRVRVVFEDVRGEVELEGVVTKADKKALHLKTEEMGVGQLLYWFYVKKVGLP